MEVAPACQQKPIQIMNNDWQKNQILQNNHRRLQLAHHQQAGTQINGGIKLGLPRRGTSTRIGNVAGKPYNFDNVQRATLVITELTYAKGDLLRMLSRGDPCHL